MYEVITFDCYGTLIDWESGIVDAFSNASKTAGVDIRTGDVMRAYLEVEHTIQAADYRSYRDTLREAACKTAGLLGWTVELENAGFLAESLPRWTPFADTNAALDRLKGDGYRLGILSNIDDDLLAGTLEHLTVDFDYIVTAEAVHSYKPAHQHFLRARKDLAESSWLHVAQSYFHDVVPAYELGVPVVWANRKGDVPVGEARPDGEVPTLAALVHWLREHRLDADN